MNTKFTMPVASLLAIIIGGLLLNDFTKTKTVIVGGLLVALGMIGCLIAIVNYRKK